MTETEVSKAYNILKNYRKLWTTPALNAISIEGYCWNAQRWNINVFVYPDNGTLVGIKADKLDADILNGLCLFSDSSCLPHHQVWPLTKKQLKIENIEPKKCTCPMNELMAYGCKCGGK